MAGGSGGLQGEHPLHVPGQGDQAPFPFDLVEAAQVELSESHHRLDDAEHRFRRLLVVRRAGSTPIGALTF